MYLIKSSPKTQTSLFLRQTFFLFSFALILKVIFIIFIQIKKVKCWTITRHEKIKNVIGSQIRAHTLHLLRNQEHAITMCVHTQDMVGALFIFLWREGVLVLLYFYNLGK